MTVSNGHAKWIQKRLDELAAQTTMDGGIWRAIYTEEDKKAKKLIKRYMEEAGLEVREDPVGNVFGRVEGISERVVLTGSHIDTVKNGGKYDGALGVVTAICVLGNLVRRGKRPAKTMEVVAFAEEEGSRYGLGYIGSRAVAGKLTEKDLLQKDESDITLKEAMTNAGYDSGKIGLAKRGDIDMYIELHIEQGPVLEQKKKQIGIVNNIVGLRVYRIEIKGEQNHAGTTPMGLRRDPVKAMVRFITEMDRTVGNVSETATITFGKIDAFPGMSNVVPERVEMLMDLRDADDKILDTVENEMTDRIKELEQTGYRITVDRMCSEPAVALSRQGIDKIRAAVKEKGFDYMEINSGAGHDAQIMAEHFPSCMIFIPSKGGVSHNPLEYSSLEDIEAGAEVLEKAISLLAW